MENKAPQPAWRWLYGPIKVLAVVVGLAASCVGLMSIVGLWTDSLWIALGAAAAVVVVVPLVLADRALPDDGSARPGLVTDIAAMSWMGGATAAVLLGSSALHGPLTAQAAQFDDRGWSHLASMTRTVAGPEPTSVKPSDAEVSESPTPMSPETIADVPASDTEQDAVEASAEGTAANADGDDDDDAGALDTTAKEAAQDEPRSVLEPAALFKAWAPSVVTINTEYGFGSGGGTGFVIDDKGTIATNYHVIARADSISIKLFDGTEADAVQVLETNEEDDLALLRMKVDSVPTPVVLGLSSQVEVGESVVVIGNPIGLEHTMTDGLVSARRLYQDKKYIQMSAPVSPGNSGGPVFDKHGDVIGVTVAKLSGENLNLAIPVDVLKPMIKDEYPQARGFGKSRW